VMIYRCHHAQARRGQVRMPGSLLESTGESLFASAEARIHVVPTARCNKANVPLSIRSERLISRMFSQITANRICKPDTSERAAGWSQPGRLFGAETQRGNERPDLRYAPRKLVDTAAAAPDDHCSVHQRAFDLLKVVSRQA